MKNRIIAILLCFTLCLFVFLPIRNQAYADPMTIAQISSLAFGIGNSFGLDFSMFGITAQGANTYLQGAINKWLNGSTILEKFGAEQAKLLAGKLIIPFQLYNGIKEFLSQFVKDNDIDETSKDIEVVSGNYSYSFAGFQKVNSTIYAFYNITNLETGSVVLKRGGGWGDLPKYTGEFRGFLISGGIVYGRYERFENGHSIGIWTDQLGEAGDTLSKVGAKLDGAIPETVLNPDEAWSGTLGGEDWPDTNLDDLLGHIDDMVIDGTLDVEGEVIEPPAPPTPVPTWIPVDDVIDGINGLGEELDGIGNDIGDISGHLDDIGDQIGDISGAIDGIQEGINTQTGVISGAIEQAAQDVVDAIGEQSAAIEDSLADTAEATQEIAEALQPGEIEPKKFDLRRLFPFCIPFDIHNLLQKFNATPVAPHVQLPFVIQSLGFSYTFDLDFSAFDPVAQAMRTVEFIVFAIGLAWATSKVIKW